MARNFPANIRETDFEATDCSLFSIPSCFHRVFIALPSRLHQFLRSKRPGERSAPSERPLCQIRGIHRTNKATRSNNIDSAVECDFRARSNEFSAHVRTPGPACRAARKNKADFVRGLCLGTDSRATDRSRDLDRRRALCRVGQRPNFAVIASTGLREPNFSFFRRRRKGGGPRSDIFSKSDRVCKCNRHISAPDFLGLPFRSAYHRVIGPGEFKYSHSVLFARRRNSESRGMLAQEGSLIFRALLSNRSIVGIGVLRENSAVNFLLI